MTKPDADRGRLVAAHEDAAEFYRRVLLGPGGDGPRRYLVDRGFETLLGDTRWTIGYAPPGWTRLRDHLTDLGYRDNTLLAAGLTTISRRGTPVDSFRDRITFGIRDTDGSLVGFTARCSPYAPDHLPKYLNTCATAIYDKSRVLFGLGEAAGRACGPVVLTEGGLDAIAVDLGSGTQPTPPRALALCGTAITDHNRRTLLALQPSEIVLAFDHDHACTRARENAYRLLRGITDLTAIDHADDGDLAETLRRDGPAAVNDIVRGRRPAIDAIIDARLATWPNRTDNAETAIACLRSLAQLVGDLRPDDMARQARTLRDSINLPTATVTRELAEAITTHSTR